MSLKTKLKFIEYVNEVYMSLRKEYGNDAARTLMLHWLFEIKDVVITKSNV